MYSYEWLWRRLILLLLLLHATHNCGNYKHKGTFNHIIFIFCFYLLLINCIIIIISWIRWNGGSSSALRGSCLKFIINCPSMTCRVAQHIRFACVFCRFCCLLLNSPWQAHNQISSFFRIFKGSKLFTSRPPNKRPF